MSQPIIDGNTQRERIINLLEEMVHYLRKDNEVPPWPIEQSDDNSSGEELLAAKENEELREGEKWLKEAAQACMVVAALIATVAFAAAITVPGGNKGDTGFPVFLHSTSFLIFAISDGISLAYSSVSMMALLSIYTSRQAQEDFLLVSQRKLTVGLAALSMSITAMMIMFSATFFMLFKDGMLWIPILVTLISSTPVFFFYLLHPQLSYEIVVAAPQLLIKAFQERGGSRWI